MGQVSLMQSAAGAEVVLDGRKVLYFAGTAYLGLQSHPRVIRAACEAAQAYGIGAATSRAGFGNQPPVLDLEGAACEYFGQEAAFYFPSGYAGPAALLEGLGPAPAAIFIDEQSHYAAFDAARSSEFSITPFAHRDAGDLRRKIRGQLRPGERAIVMSDGVFAASGRLAPVDDYLDVLGRYAGGFLLLDDAHGVGILGEDGRGTFDHFQVRASQVNNPNARVTGPRVLACATLSKALGGYGGIICGAGDYIQAIRSTSHQFDGCNPPPAPIAAASATAIRMLMADPSPRQRLLENARRLRGGLLRIGLDVEDGPTPIVPLDLGDSALMERAQQRLLARDLAVGYLRYPGTGEHGALRIAVCSLHTPEMIDMLIAGLRECL